MVAYYKDTDDISGTSFVPFSFDEGTKNNPSKVELIFVCKGTKYKYGFSVDGWKIVDEYLYEYKSSRAALIFERKNTIDYKFTVEYKNLKNYTKDNPWNRLFLCEALKSEVSEIKDVFEFLTMDFCVINNQSLLEDNLFVDFFRRCGNDPEVKKFAMSFVK